jgi:DNA end-binding protein Ku
MSQQESFHPARCLSCVRLDCLAALDQIVREVPQSADALGFVRQIHRGRIVTIEAAREQMPSTIDWSGRRTYRPVLISSRSQPSWLSIPPDTICATQVPTSGIFSASIPRMARPLWKGTLGFGLVSIPIQILTAVRDTGPHFHFLRERDLSRIKLQKVAEKDRKPVEQDELVKGYEYDKGRYVVLTNEDFEKAAVKRNSAIELLDFVPDQEIDDRYFDKPYYLVPQKGGERAYVLLREALKESCKVGIAKIVMRDTPHLAAVEAIEDALVLSTMRFAEELVKEKEYDFPKVSVRGPELKMAQQLIDGLAGEWDPAKYTNEYRANLLKIIEAKRKKKTPKLEVQEVEADSKVVDLMERLRESLGQAGKGRTAATKTTRARKPKGTKRKRAA